MTMRVLLSAFLSAALCLSASVAAAEDRPDITDKAVLGVTTGMTLAQARKKLRGLKWQYEARFMVDFSGDCAIKGGEEILCLMVYERGKRKPSDKIQAIVVVSGKLKARDGVRVGMKIAEVEKLWGKATFSFNYENEAREYVDFAKAPKRLLIRAKLKGEAGFAGGHLGVYPKDKADEPFQKTGRYNPKAVIGSIWVN